MKEVTGKAMEIESSGEYLEDCTAGGGFLMQLPSNRGTRKATLLTPEDELVKVSIPTSGFISEGDVVTAIKDDDGCEFVYENHTTEKDWSFGRADAGDRTKAFWAGKAISWLPIPGIILAFFAGAGNGGIGGMSLPVTLIGAAWVTAIIWSLFIYRGQVKARLMDASRFLEQAKSDHADFLSRANSDRVERLKKAGA